MVYSAGLIGCGSIGALKPDHLDSKLSTNILTHANALNTHNKINFVGVVDIDEEKRNAAAEKWGVRAFPTVELLFDDCDLDIVICAVNTENHFTTLLEILIQRGNNLKTVIVEKPFCENSKRAMEITRKYLEYGINLIVNYQRNFIKEYAAIKRMFDKGILDDGPFGKAMNCRVLYTRGLKHEGCHAINFLLDFFGDCIYSEILDAGYGIPDRDATDESVSVFAVFEKCTSVVLQPVDGRCYGIFEIDICFEKCRLRFIENGLWIERYPIVTENEYGHKSLGYGTTEVIRTNTGLNTSLYECLDQAVESCKACFDNKKLLENVTRAIKVHEFIEDTKE